MRKFIKNISDLKIRRHYSHADEQDRRYISFGRDWKVGSNNLMRELAYVTRYTESMTHLKYVLGYWYLHPHFEHEKNNEIKEWFSKTNFYKYMTEGEGNYTDTDEDFQKSWMNIALFSKVDSGDMHQLSDEEIRAMFEI
ncbi:hypothetical protein HNP10_002195 [Aeromonas veronii]|uniref:hypothetical protein n=1 Tax=Aeromonas veronii TaxID=654 RepID=UPI001611C008|nr:hypothetical protein [Aeromonas veronii]MCS3833434.1 hypothetical protein [Aeromonas veronii]